MSNRLVAIGAGVFVTFLWATSYILNKLAFAEEIRPFTLSGLRYLIAVLALWAVASVTARAQRQNRDGAPGTGRTSVPKLRFPHYLLLGIAGYIMAQGLQYAGQYFVTPTQTSLLLCIGNIFFVLVVDAVWLKEIRSISSLVDVFCALIGILAYFYPWNLNWESRIGIGLIVLSSVGYAVNLSATRYFLSRFGSKLQQLVIRPMLIGAIGMLAVGPAVEGLPPFSWKLAGILVWLGIVNGALAFYIWTWSQKVLHAYESSILNNLVLIQVAVLDVWILDRELSVLQGIGLLATLLSVAYVQLAPFFNKRKADSRPMP
ncbi:DMT family transporter [Effusibacillus lacus]|uniref:EamA domain-containing protein n=1 Tax=Effusibacillus lacus TaxID=1348429 RepID=A0A292YCF0_9BACL|nr:DMT family transporter [Effusibacillus lacus]TCS75089.1 drug/metabolite transporter (DMT)-like permease [Effusibacillus lacus]GAX89042.1 hypothetical protein EFBL_0656 [Effusibacillus lacus]